MLPITVRVDETVKNRLEIIAKKKYRPIGSIVREAIDDYIEKTYGDNLDTIEKLEEFAKRFEKLELHHES